MPPNRAPSGSHILLRQAWHLAGGSVFPLLALFVSRETVLVGLAVAGVAFGAMDTLRLVSPTVSAWMARRIPIIRAAEQHRPTGSTYFVAGALVCFLVFDADVAANAVLLQAVGDPVAAAVGSRWGRHRWRGKSLEGSLAYMAAAVIAGGLLLPSHLGLGMPLLALAAVSAALLEFLPLPVDDNLRVPVLTAVVTAVAQAAV